MELLQNYPIEQILGFIVCLALAIKGCVTFWDWGYNRLRQVFQKETDEDNKDKQLEERLNKIDDSLNTLIESQKKNTDTINTMQNQIAILSESDKDDIKSFIVREYHYFTEQKGWVDDYSLDCIEKRYTHYKQEGGNSFVHGLMEGLRALPKRPPKDKE